MYEIFILLKIFNICFARVLDETETQFTRKQERFEQFIKKLPDCEW